MYNNKKRSGGKKNSKKFQKEIQKEIQILLNKKGRKKSSNIMNKIILRPIQQRQEIQ